MIEKKENSELINAHAEIMNILGAIMQMRASENSEKEKKEKKEKIEKILDRLRNNQIEPKKAIEEARAFLNSKQNTI